MVLYSLKSSECLTQHRRVVHLEKVALDRCCGCGAAGGVLHTLLPVRLLREAEKRRRPGAETVGPPEHGQRELLQIQQKNQTAAATPCFFFFFFVLQKGHREQCHSGRTDATAESYAPAHTQHSELITMRAPPNEVQYLH